MSGECRSVVLLLLGLLAFSIAVDRSNFKTCQQSGFCKRQRATPEGQSPYQVLLDTVVITDSQLSVHVLNRDTQLTLVLQITALQYNTARLQLKELTPLRERYQPPIGDVLVGEPARDRLMVDQRTDTSISLSFKQNKLVVAAQPLRLDFLVEGQPVLSVNAQGLLKWEHYRTKQAAAAVPEVEKTGDEPKEDGENEEHEQEAPEQVASDQNEEPSMWEETFKTHQDSKPHGPSSVGLDFSFPGFEFVYGIPEHADSLALKSTKNTDPYRLYNLDVFEYDLENPMALYGSVPFMLAHNEQRTLGLFWLNAAETWIDISSNVADKNMFSKLVDLIKQDVDIPQVDTHWFSESGLIDVFIFLGPTANDVFKQYAVLTGTTPLPPLFALAYHQSRWNYNDEQDVASVSSGFDEHDIPLDVIWLDIEHTDGKRYFTWDKHKFPKPAEMIDALSSVGRKMVTIVDPHIKRDDGYHMHRESRDAGHYIKNKDGNDYEGWCWPGSSSWPDFVDPAIRKFWASKFLLSAYEGSTPDLYTWNDMNEPSVFNGPEITMHKDVKHFGDWEHRDVHNIYGMYVHRATVEGQLLRSEGRKRTFVLSRAFYAGSQRYGAVWTGDNTGEWGHLKASIPMVLSLNLVGITFSGADVGGFFKSPDAELLTRWYQAGAYQPFFRAHAHLDTRRREPWLLPADNKAAIRQAIQARYSLLPYWYTLFYQAELNGGPVMKPLWVEFPGDRSSFTVEDEHLLGSALLVHPVTDAGATGVQAYLPGAQELWYDVDTYQKFTGGQKVYIPVNLFKIPVFQRGGHIVPRKQRQRRSSSLTYHDPYTLIVTLNRQGSAQGELYLDDFETFQYRQGHYIHQVFSFENAQLSSKSAHSTKSSFTTSAWLERIVVVGLTVQPKSASITAQGATSTLELTYNSAMQVLTIRKPAVPINVDFTLTLQ